MGYSTEIFISEPCQGVLCAICHDVLKDAKAFNCGHTFCANCVDDINNITIILSLAMTARRIPHHTETQRVPAVVR